MVNFDRDKMTLRIPVSKVEQVGLRKISEASTIEDALTTLKGKAKVKKIMWSRRAQEYENKINSGNPVAIAEVIRDLYRSENLAEQSYSERQIYEQALDRLANDWLDESAEAVEQKASILNMFAMFAISGIIAWAVFGVFEMQDQITSAMG